MRINQNISAMNTHASMVKADNSMSKSLERLSSGYRINRAADDAAGLAISEKMRGQISGLKQASKNAQDGISLLQTAEGNLNESHSILQRMRELADQAANGTVTDSDRAEIQKEMNQLTKEVDRIAKDTEFNTMKLLRGAKTAVALSGTVTTTGGTSSSHLAGGAAAITGDNASGSITVSAQLASGATITIGSGASAKAYTLKTSGQVSGANDIAIGADAAGTITNIVAKINDGTDGVTGITAVDGGGGAIDLTADANGIAGNLKVAVTGSNLSGANMTGGVNDIAATAGSGTISFNRQLASGDTLTVGGTTYTMIRNGATPAGNQINLGTDLSGTVDNIITALGGNAAVTATEGSDGASIHLAATTTGIASNLATGTTLGTTSQASDHITLTMQIGANAGQSMDADINNMDAGSLGIGRDANGAKVSGGTDAAQGLDVTSSTSASQALTAIDDAINKVSSERSKLGAYQNRLDHTVSNLSTAAENLSASESRIRDVDMADEMSNFSRAQILMQASTAMMAQANQKPQAVLKLLG